MEVLHWGRYIWLNSLTKRLNRDRAEKLVKHTNRDGFVHLY